MLHRVRIWMRCARSGRHERADVRGAHVRFGRRGRMRAGDRRRVFDHAPDRAARAAPTAAQRAATWRIALLVLAQPVCAALLYFALLPPTTPGEAGTLVVATADATAVALGAGQGGDAVVALPEAPALAGIERVPDLATALRRHPGMQRIRVLGAGLEARDRDAVRGYALHFVPNALPRGLVELDAPAHATAGGAFRVDGRAHELRGGVAELLRSGRHARGSRRAHRSGRFTLSATTRVPGAAIFSLRLRDARQRVVEDIALPLEVDAQPAPRVLLLAGAPGPEVKYLRRWARDAGLALQVQLSVGGGMQLGDAPIALNAASLKGFDLVDPRRARVVEPGRRPARGLERGDPRRPGRAVACHRRVVGIRAAPLARARLRRRRRARCRRCPSAASRAATTTRFVHASGLARAIRRAAMRHRSPKLRR